MYSVNWSSDKLHPTVMMFALTFFVYYTSIFVTRLSHPPPSNWCPTSEKDTSWDSTVYLYFRSETNDKSSNKVALPISTHHYSHYYIARQPKDYFRQLVGYRMCVSDDRVDNHEMRLYVDQQNKEHSCTPIKVSRTYMYITDIEDGLDLSLEVHSFKRGMIETTTQVCDFLHKW